jgi:uncharacterized protein (TIGR02466 family)
MKSYEIHPIFPQSIYYAPNVCSELLETLEIECKNTQKESGTRRSPTLFVDSCCWTADLKERYPFYTLSDQIKHHVANYANELGYSVTADNIHIDNMWFNISNEGDFNFPHAHGDCHFSGAFYVKTTPENSIIFYHPQYLNAQIPPPVEENTNHLSYSQVEYRCIESSLMVWRNYMVHSTPRQMGEGEKIVISFNTVIKRNYNE